MIAAFGPIEWISSASGLDISQWRRVCCIFISYVPMSHAIERLILMPEARDFQALILPGRAPQAIDAGDIWSNASSLEIISCIQSCINHNFIHKRTAVSRNVMLSSSLFLIVRIT